VLAIDYPEVNALIRKRKLTKAKDTYLVNYLREQVDGVIHTNFNLHLARSFRPSTDSPNLANVPTRDPEIKKIVRKAVKARPGHKIVSADFKGVEVSVAYDYHKDPDMEIYLRDKSNDMHRDMAERIYILERHQVAKPIRQTTKGAFVFAQFYGDWWKSCASSLWLAAHQEDHLLPDGTRLIDHLASKGFHTLEQFEKHVESVERWMWDVKWPIYTQWKKDWWANYQRRGYFDSLTGFRYSGLVDRKQACNYPIQGSAFHAMLQCIIWVDEDSRKEGWDSFICNQIYDDLMLDVHPDEEEMVLARIRKYMTERLPEHWPWILVPLEVEVEMAGVDETWYDKKEVK
jgi:DNA polymerase-1